MDVVYATGLHLEAIFGAWLARRPVITKIVGDEVWERAIRRGWTQEDFNSFQTAQHRDPRIRLMSWLRRIALRRSTVVLAPSEHLAAIVRQWVVGFDLKVVVIPNGIRIPERTANMQDTPPLRATFVGRLVLHKRVHMLLEAVALTKDVRLTVVGDGPESHVLRERCSLLGISDRVLFTGAISRSKVMRELSESNVLVTASDYEGLPHVVPEAFACGRPVLAPKSPDFDLIRDGEDGLLVDASASAFAEGLVRLRDDNTLLRTLGANARERAHRWSFELCAERLLELFRHVASRPGVVFVGSGAAVGAHEAESAKRFEVLTKHLDLAVVGRGTPDGRRAYVPTLSFPYMRPKVLSTIAFYIAGPILALSWAKLRRSTVLVCQSPYEAITALLLRRLLLGPPIRIVVEVHGDWRTATRWYGGRIRRPLAPIGDGLAAWALRRAELIRVVGTHTEGLVREIGVNTAIDRFLTFSDYDFFLASPPATFPSEPNVVFVGSLAPVKGVDLLLDAWPRIAKHTLSAKLVIIGDGPLMPHLRKRTPRLGGRVSLKGSLSRRQILDALDKGWLLVLPSRSEGLPRVILEANARARPVVATGVGGVPELVEHGVTGLLVPPENPLALADAIIEALSDQKRLNTMGREARRRIEERQPSAEFEAGIARLAQWTLREAIR